MERNDFKSIAFWILVLLYQWMVGIVMVFVPRKYRYKSVKNEIILITGGGMGLGRLMSLDFAKRGAKIVLWDINEKGMEQSAEMIKAIGGKVWTYVCDVSNRNEVYRLASQVKEDVGPVTMLINNAGIVLGKSFLEAEDEKLTKCIDVNLMAHFWTCKAFLPHMLATNHGHIVTIASVAGLAGSPQLTDYAASKFGSVGFEESLRFELKLGGHNNVHSTVVCPWFVNTGMFDGVTPQVIPLLEPEFVAKRIVSGVLVNQEVIFVPRFIYFLNALKSILPSEAIFALLKVFGGSKFMKTFKGRKEK